MCAIDTETTGLISGYHEIIQMSFLPLNEKLEPSGVFPLFDIILMPDHPERIEREALRKIGRDKFELACNEGVNQLVAFELWELWFQKLNLGEKRRVTPLGYNYASFDQWMLREWMGPENYGFYMDSRIRDPFLVANFLNDKADFHGRKPQYPNLKLGQIARNNARRS
jgi:hypothetical protein